ncbi:hypothetical protein DV113_003499 [Geotrichum candidum]|uniref:Uncharacterized protein n=1 Tax=Geotrichum candidum TaxID=1173061 RepID=A0A0J9XEW0_GEOCN|nr:hypothetical protein DV113_003499 [Geotrichum candidum]KAI9214547.1 hypothetical protein DS838_000626 [Geotrichum bryndzae]CDO55838.1 similar to Saccharomyces cerevisiae YKL100C YPF1 Putative protein of unknown function with similarity to a human minor histocompatibility antigen and signal peptide peptidases [Geotrichum candidum]
MNLTIVPDFLGLLNQSVNITRSHLENYNDYLLYDLDFLWSHLPFPPVYFTYYVIVVLAVCIVAASSFATIRKPTSAEPADKQSPLYHPLDDAKVNPFQSQTLEASEAYLMPVIGGISLVSIYMAFKYFSASNIQVIFSVYFALVSSVSYANVFSLSLQSAARVFFNATIPHWRISFAIDNEHHCAGIEPGLSLLEKEEARERKEKKEKLQRKGDLKKLEKIEQEERIEQELNKAEEDVVKEVIPSTIASDEQYFNLFLSLGEVLGLPSGISLVALQYVTKHWILSNILGAAVAVQGVRTLRLDSFKTGFIMLLGLFLYDIYFVFGTDVMVTVATKLDIPIKLEVPRPPLEEAAGKVMRSTAMLGLGDIVVPALFLSLCLRFDLYSFYKKNKGLSFHLARPYSKPYFIWGLVAYTLGLVVTIVVMHIFQAGQPALLYLCPAIAATTLLVGYVRGELGELYAFSDIDDNEQRERSREERRKAIEARIKEEKKAAAEKQEKVHEVSEEEEEESEEVIDIEESD